jgi:hypothetical protein
MSEATSPGEVKIGKYNLHQRGENGLAVLIPRVWWEDNECKPGDTVEIYRTTGESDDLIIRVNGKQVQA